MSHELDIPEYLKISQENRMKAWEIKNQRRTPVQVIASQISTKPVEQVVDEIMNEPVDLTVEIKALAVSAHLNYLIWLKRQVEVNLPSEAAKPVLMVWEGLSQPSKPAVQSVGKQDGRGHHYAGKLWVLNRKTGERARIEPIEFSAYEARGFVKAGPRSK